MGWWWLVGENLWGAPLLGSVFYILRMRLTGWRCSNGDEAGGGADHTEQPQARQDPNEGKPDLLRITMRTLAMGSWHASIAPLLNEEHKG